VLSQNSTLFPATIEENIKLGEDFYRREELEGILRKVKLPFDLDYTIEENASNVSQGEKERVLLARLIAHNKNFVILDEPLEGVDIETKKEIISFLKEYLKDRTVLVITHRDEIAQSLCEREMMV
jgi:ABC-type transport system involved in cytochrome bd biosynthesis fused ATPase/permease subunit